MEKEILQVVPLSSLYKVFPECEPESSKTGCFTALKNEPLSVQFAYRLGDYKDDNLSLNVKIETDLPVSLYSVGYVPVAHTQVSELTDHYAPGLFPDILFPKKVNPEIRKSFITLPPERRPVPAGPADRHEYFYSGRRRPEKYLYKKKFLCQRAGAGSPPH